MTPNPNSTEELRKQLAKDLHETIIGYNLRADGFKVAHDDGVIKHLWAIAVQFGNETVQQFAEGLMEQSEQQLNGYDVIDMVPLSAIEAALDEYNNKNGGQS